MREIEQAEITEYLKTLFETQTDRMRVLWQEYDQDAGGAGKPVKVFIDLQEQLNYTPSIEIVEKGSDNEIFSIGTQEQKFNFEILVNVNNNHPELSSKYNKIIGNAVFLLLNEFNRRSFQIPGRDYCVYYSEATSLDFGYRRGKGFKTSKITWFCKLLKMNRYT